MGAERDTVVMARIANWVVGLSGALLVHDFVPSDWVFVAAAAAIAAGSFAVRGYARRVGDAPTW